MSVRVAGPDDAFALLRLYQLSRESSASDPLLMDLKALERDLARNDRLWVLAEDAALSATLEPALRLGKVQRLFTVGPREGRHAARVRALKFLVEKAAREGALDAIYTTTRHFTLEEQAATLECGFHVLGVFPNAIAADPNRLNGLTAWFADGVLMERREGGFALHPAVAPFYELARRQCGLPSLSAASPEEPPYAGRPVPALELIEAPRFAARRFAKLQERKSLSVNFYPFHEPNALLTSPDQSVEVFATLAPERRLANLIGERLTLAVDPVELYRRVCGMLRERGIQYLEIINDAADAVGIECILRAGFAPCGYFPCLRRNGDTRRDYVVFARSFEFYDYEPLPVDPRYEEWLFAFCAARDTIPKVPLSGSRERAG